jgi:anti-anti-sigma factor
VSGWFEERLAWWLPAMSLRSKEAAMAPLSQSATTASDGHAIVTLCGDLDTDTAAQLWQYLSYLISQGHHHIVLDLRGMILIDSAGIDVLARVSA